MSNTVNWAGWIIALILSIVCVLQRSCSPMHVPSLYNDALPVHIKTDTEWVEVQDTVLSPIKIVYKYADRMSRVDTQAILKDYFAGRIYADTIKGYDVQAIIRDSVFANKIAGRKVYIQNTRPTMAVIPVKNALFIGGFLGFSAKNREPSAGISVQFCSKKDRMYFYQYDLINRIHSVGICWKLSLKRK